MATIVKKKWLMQVNKIGPEFDQEGWYLFGFIPLYVRDLSRRERRS